MKTHLHEDQFDDAFHAVCGRFPHDPRAGEKYFEKIVCDDVFETLPRKVRCKYCTDYWWPKGFGDPK
jgi:hypothetical protein